MAADVRSWHSLQPRETRNDCGGCHQHQPGQAIPFAGTVADQEPPLDMVGATPFLGYDATCTPVLRWTRRPTMTMPEWKAEIWPGFDQHCGDCHNSNRSTDPTALAALDYVDEASAYNKLRARNYANSILGALGSPALWAARGERTDGRRNDLAKYQPNYSAGQWGYRFSAIHAANPGLCNQNDAAMAQWVYRFGQWIDNHLPRDTGAAYGWKHDWYHPSVDAALSAADCSPTELRVGFWDDSGWVAELLVSVNDAVVASHTNYRNGSILVPLGGVTTADTVQITLRDYADNRQLYAKAVTELQRECRRQLPVTPIPVGVLGRLVRPPGS